ncbi:hypothetical protein M9H77_06278 [Catharanthus roseus]|uniref:Uncharacterized protein n=1 Tax=Catharanthus roseus TaxID=4058 RepID=A0ACC0BS25_CATRO|nr:hypothetical protein M9H77_06278 [Catharanthus roseus]
MKNWEFWQKIREKVRRIEGVSCIKNVFDKEDAMNDGGKSDGEGIPRANIDSDVYVVNDKMNGADEDDGIDAEQDDMEQEDVADENHDSQVNEPAEDCQKKRKNSRWKKVMKKMMNMKKKKWKKGMKMKRTKKTMMK